MSHDSSSASTGMLRAYVRASVTERSQLTQRKFDRLVSDWLQENPWRTTVEDEREWAIIHQAVCHFETYTLLTIELRLRRNGTINELDSFSHYIESLLGYLRASDGQIVFTTEGDFRWRIGVQ